MKNKYVLSLAGSLIFLLFYASSTIGVMSNPVYQRIVIPYTAVSNGWWTGLAIHNQSAISETYNVFFYDKDGTYINGTNVVIPAHGIKKDVLQNFAKDPTDISGNVSVYIQTDGLLNEDPFSATLFIGNTASNQGFGFDTYQSEEYVDIPVQI